MIECSKFAQGHHKVNTYVIHCHEMIYQFIFGAAHHKVSRIINPKLKNHEIVTDTQTQRDI